MSGRVFVLIGPSGAGKTSLVKKAKACGIAEPIITCTTRVPRPDEVDGVDYHFLSLTRFNQLFESGELAEREKIHGNWYGTPITSLADALTQEKTAIIAMGFAGAKLVKARWPQQVSLVFVMPPSIDALYQRLKHRGTDGEELDMRLDRRRIAQELALDEMADFVIHNDDLDQAFNALCTICDSSKAFHHPID